MAKLKKSIKAIIISLCAVVVIAGSIVGAVFANKNKGKDGDPTNPSTQQTPSSPTGPSTPLVPEISFVGSQVGLMQAVNSSSTEISVIEKLDDEIISKGNFNVSDVVEIADNFVVVKQNGAKVVYLYSLEGETAQIKTLEEVLNKMESLGLNLRKEEDE